MNFCANHTCTHLCVIHKARPLCLCRDGMPARLKNNTACEDETIKLDDRQHPIDNGLQHHHHDDDNSSPIVAANSTNDDAAGNGSLWIGLTCGLLAFVALSSIYYYVKKKRPNLMHRPNLKWVFFFSLDRVNGFLLCGIWILIDLLVFCFRNPFDGIRFIKRRSNNTATTTSNSTLTLMPGQHEYANPISDMSNARV